MNEMKRQKKLLLGGLAFALLFGQGIGLVEAKGKESKPKNEKKQTIVDKNKNGIADSWEAKYKLGSGKDVAKKDNDKDGLNNLIEYQLNFNPLSVDTDKDKVKDGNEDYDNDKLTNLQELQAKLNPALSDSDKDKVLDSMEDNDGDKLTTIEEIIVQSSPVVSDSDKDGIKDGQEDKDLDFITNEKEFDLRLNPNVSDSDKDGIVDGDEDLDSDGLTNEVELELGQNPLNKDSDNDGVRDGSEDKNKDGVQDLNQLRELKIEIKTLKGKKTQIQYEFRDGAFEAKIKDETGTLLGKNIHELVQELALLPNEKQSEMIARIQEVLGIDDFAKMEVKAKFFNGTKIKIEIENEVKEPAKPKQEEPKDEEHEHEDGKQEEKEQQHEDEQQEEHEE
jgi:hypothetical protein